jgi:hypothetical protein
VIEVGAGNGLNFPHHPRSVTDVVAVEPEPLILLSIRHVPLERRTQRRSLRLVLVPTPSGHTPALAIPAAPRA